MPASDRSRRAARSRCDQSFTCWRIHGFRSRSQTRFLLHLDPLEPRIAPAVYNVPADMTLPAAITAADSNTDSENTINVAPGTYQVIGQEIQAPQAKSLVIAGQGSGVIFQSDGKSGRVLEIDANVTLENLTSERSSPRTAARSADPLPWAEAC